MKRTRATSKPGTEAKPKPKVAAAEAARSGLAPGSYRPLIDVWGELPELAPRLPEGSVALVDARVAKLHPSLVRALESRRCRIVSLSAGEKVKSLRVLERVLKDAVGLSRSGTLLVAGGGTVGDLGTVAAHVLKRGVRLVQVPTTLLAAVDSSVGGKGAVHAADGRHLVKNAVGVFHYSAESWLCPALFSTLSERQLREGRLEALKMFLCLSPPLWRKHLRTGAPSSLEPLVKDARRVKDGVCEEDPYEQRGIRQVLNFGHTFGHVLESLSSFRVSHGDAVGERMGLTPAPLVREVESSLERGAGLLGRGVLAKVLARADEAAVEALLKADKKTGPNGELNMVLVEALGRWRLEKVPSSVWRPLLRQWQAARRGGAA